MLIDMVRYDVGRFTNSLADLRVPVMAILTTYSNERRERRSLTAGQYYTLSEHAGCPNPVGKDRNHRGYRAFPTDR